MVEETLKRHPHVEINGESPFVDSFFLNQHKTLPVRLGPRTAFGDQCSRTTRNSSVDSTKPA